MTNAVLFLLGAGPGIGAQRASDAEAEGHHIALAAWSARNNHVNVNRLELHIDPATQRL